MSAIAGSVTGKAWDPVEKLFRQDPAYDLTDAKLAWRVNLFTETEFRNGYLADSSARGGALTNVPLAGYLGAVRFALDTVTTFVYKTGAVPNTMQTFSCIFEMEDDLGPPVIGPSNASSDCYLVTGGSSRTSGATITPLGGRRYEVSVSYMYGTTGLGNNGVAKTANMSARSFIVTAYQLSKTPAIVPYQAITDGYTEFKAAFPKHRLYQDTAGQMPVMSPEQPVGLIVDNSSDFKVGPEMSVDPTFTDTAQWGTPGAGWTVAGDGKVVGTDVANAVYVQMVSGTRPTYAVDQWYQWEITIDSITGTLGMTIAGQTFTFTYPGTYKGWLKAAATTGIFGLRASSATLTCQVSKLSCKLFYGRNTSQATTTARPIWTKRVNFLTYTEDLTNAAWTPLALTVTNNSSTAPDGTNTMTLLQVSSGGSARQIYQTFSTPGGSPSRAWVWLKAGTISDASFTLYRVSPAKHQVTGIRILQGPGTVSINPSGIDGGIGYISGLSTTVPTLVEIDSEANTVTTSMTCRIYMANASTVNTGDSIYVWHPMVVSGLVRYPYQKVIDANNYDMAPYFPKYFRYDGIDDVLDMPYTQGLTLDASNLTTEKLTWRYNNFTETEFRNGVVADSYSRTGDVSNATLSGFAGAVQYPDNTATSFVYKIGSVAGLVNTISAFVQMDDGLAPVVGNFSSGDFALVIGGALVTNATVSLYSGDIYLVQGSRVPGTANPNNNGIVKYTGSTSRPFKTSGWQIILGSVNRAYQAITNFNDDFCRRFPNHALFQDQYGATPVTNSEQPVGLILDRSRTPFKGPNVVGNSTFDADVSNWTAGSAASITWVTGMMQLTGGGSIGSTANNWVRARTASGADITYNGYELYEIEFDAQYVSGAGNLQCGVTYSPALTVSYTTNNGKMLRYRCLAWSSLAGPSGGTQGGGVVFGASAGAVWNIDNVTSRRVFGNHIYQPTTAARPILSTRQNLLIDTDGWANTGWSFGGTRTPYQVGSDGDISAILFSAVGGETGASTMSNRVVGDTAITAQIDLKFVSGNPAKNLLVRNNTTSTNFTLGVIADLQTGAISGAGWTSQSLGNGWFRYTFIQTTGISIGDSIRLYVGVTSSTVPNAMEWLVDKPQLVDGDKPLPYQKVSGSVPQVVGFPRYFLLDGVDDGWISLGNFDMTQNTDLSMFAAVKSSLAVSSTGMVYEHSSNISNVGAWDGYYATSVGGNGTISHRFSVTGTAESASLVSGPTIQPHVWLAGHQMGVSLYCETDNRTRVTTSSSGPQMAGLNTILYLGSRAGTQFFYKGRIYRMIFIGRQTTANEQQLTRYWLNNQVKAI